MRVDVRRAGWAALTVAGVLLPFAPAVLGLRTLAHRDTQQLYAPVRTLVVEALRDGRLPLWNPYEATGTPLFAEGIHSVLHPLSLLAAFVAPASIDFLILAWLAFAALGTFLLARTLGASPPASSAAGIAFALSGFSASMTGNLVFLAGLATLPWLLAAARVAGRGSPWGPALTALATACGFFTGDAQITAVGLALGLLLAAGSGGGRGALRALAGMAAGVLLAGIQLAATWGALPATVRGVGLADWEKSQWPLEPLRLVEWLVPGLLRGSPAEIPMTPSGEWLPKLFSESVYLGVPLLVAAGVGAWRGRSRAARLLAIAAVALLWLALGDRLGARQALDWVPLWNRFRYAEKFMAPLTLCACALAALGIDAFRREGLARRGRWLVASAALLAGGGLLALHVAPDTTRALLEGRFGERGLFLWSSLALGLPHTVLALAALLLLDRLRAGPVRAAALAALIPLSLAAAVQFGAHLGSPDAHRYDTTLRLESDAPTARIAHPGEMGYLRSEAGDFVDLTARMETAILRPATNVALRVDALGFYGALVPLRWALLEDGFGDAWAREARRFGVTHVALMTPYNPARAVAVKRTIEGGLLLQRDAERRFELWAVPHRPWTSFALGAVAAPSLPEAERALHALVERGDEGTVVVESPTPPAIAPGKVWRMERAAEWIRVEAEALGPALLVVADAFWPGWQATIDGQPAEILAADVLVRAVRWPPGHHVLEMTYDPPELRTGLALSGLGALLSLLLAGIGLSRLQKERGPAKTGPPSVKRAAMP